jgi:putative MFS transporter
MSVIASRIERLPFSRFHWHLLLMGGLGYTFDGLDAAVVAFILPVLRAAWSLTSLQVGYLGSSTYIGLYSTASPRLPALSRKIGRHSLVAACSPALEPAQSPRSSLHS